MVWTTTLQKRICKTNHNYNDGKDHIETEAYMNKQVIFEIKDYLERIGLYSVEDDNNEIEQRKRGKQYDFIDHLKAMIYAMLTNQNVWKRVVPKLTEIDKLFSYYDPDAILAHPGEYYSRGIMRLSCGSRATKAQMDVLHDNIITLKRIERDYGSLDKYVLSSPAHKLVEELSSSRSEYKIKQLGPALAWEYLRNVGIDGAKPDVHMKRFMGAERMSISSRSEATDTEVLTEVDKLSEETGYSKFVIDYLIWQYCAEGYAEICTSSPRCDKCVVRKHCKQSLN